MELDTNLKQERSGGCCGGHENKTHSIGPRFRNLILFASLAIIGFFLFTEHRAHLFGVLPYLLLLACPLMHFLHGRHGGS